VSYKTAWRMGHKICELMDSLGISEPLSGHVEVDETYLSGKRRGDKRCRGAEGKTLVFGALERGGEVRGRVVSVVKKRTLEPIVRATVKEGSVVTAGFSGYDPHRMMHMYGLHEGPV
jgi:transposase